MCDKSGMMPDGANIHRAVREGLWPFIITFGTIHGYNNLFVISRVNTPEAGGGWLGVGWVILSWTAVLELLIMQRRRRQSLSLHCFCEP